MRLRIVLVFIAIIIAAGAVFGVIIYINSIRASYEEGVEEVEVLVAAQNIPKEVAVEDLIPAGMVEIKGIPRVYLAEGVLTSLDEFEGYVVAAPINAGEQITTTKFIRPEEIGLAFIVPDGMIAVSIPFNEVIGVSNLINVGDRVNIIATFFPEEELSLESFAPVTGEQAEEGIETTTAEEEVSEGVIKDTTKTLLWNIEVLYIGTRAVASDEAAVTGGIFGGQQEAGEDSEEIKTVTLAVTPEDSEKLVFSEEAGSVWLALVPTDGIEEEETEPVTLDNVFKD
jgi:pilus assembly protein CpaB